VRPNSTGHVLAVAVTKSIPALVTQLAEDRFDRDPAGLADQVADHQTRHAPDGLGRFPLAGFPRRVSPARFGSGVPDGDDIRERVADDAVG